MNKEDLIGYCKFFKGKESYPETLTPEEKTLWDYERSWVNDMVKYHSPKYENTNSPMDEETALYIAVGLREFKNMDGRPLSLKAHIFHRMTKWNYSTESTILPFKKLYEKYYN